LQAYMRQYALSHTQSVECPPTFLIFPNEKNVFVWR
jgi:hypothetical protein